MTLGLLVLIVLVLGLLATMPIWAGWWKPIKGQRRGKRRFRR